MSKVLGIYNGHDAGACLLVNGVIRVMIEEERLNRYKHGVPGTLKAEYMVNLPSQVLPSLGYPARSVAYCLRRAGLSIDELDAIVVTRPNLVDLVPVRDPERIMVISQHHLAHAFSAFYPSGFDEAAVLVIDGDGEHTPTGYESETGYSFSLESHTEIFKNTYRPRNDVFTGLGWMYSNISALIGFSSSASRLDEPGKTMGLAPLGRPTRELEGNWVEVDGFKLDFSPFEEWAIRHGYREEFACDGRTRLVSDETNIPQTAADLAWKAQKELERVVLHLGTELQRETGHKKLCMAGGVALNSVANGLLIRSGAYDEVFVQPAASDCGQSLGLAYMGHALLAKRSKTAIAVPPMQHAYLGAPYPASEVESVLEQSGLDFERLDGDGALIEHAASTLEQGGIIGWFQGGSEVGPRALGHRSILANPTGAGTKDRVNARVKFREPFRPFAPSVLADRASEVFEIEGDCRFMLNVVDVREAWRSRIPAVTHVDGTARVQTVSRESEPLYYGLIESFAKRTEVPLVLNTSFNLRGMPIVESPLDALRCFLLTNMTRLYLGHYCVSDYHAETWTVTLRKDVEIERFAGGATKIGRLKGRSKAFADADARILRALDGFAGGASAASLSAGDTAKAKQLVDLAKRLMRAGLADAQVGDLVVGLPY